MTGGLRSTISRAEAPLLLRLGNRQPRFGKHAVCNSRVVAGAPYLVVTSLLLIASCSSAQLASLNLTPEVQPMP